MKQAEKLRRALKNQCELYLISILGNGIMSPCLKRQFYKLLKLFRARSLDFFSALDADFFSSGSQKDDTRYSPAECTGIEKKHIEGAPQFDLISTSYVERQNLTMSMHSACTSCFTTIAKFISRLESRQQ